VAAILALGVAKSGAEVAERKADEAESRLIAREEETDTLIKAAEAEVARLRAEIEQLRGETSRLNAVLRKWAARWKAEAKFRGWPASRHEKNRRELERLRVENEELRRRLNP
jgi:hypothetical protein